jgi:hypothetical protein
MFIIVVFLTGIYFLSMDCRYSVMIIAATGHSSAASLTASSYSGGTVSNFRLGISAAHFKNFRTQLHASFTSHAIFGNTYLHNPLLKELPEFSIG